MKQRDKDIIERLQWNVDQRTIRARKFELEKDAFPILISLSRRVMKEEIIRTEGDMVVVQYWWRPLTDEDMEEFDIWLVEKRETDRIAYEKQKEHNRFTNRVIRWFKGEIK